MRGTVEERVALEESFVPEVFFFFGINFISKKKKIIDH